MRWNKLVSLLESCRLANVEKDFIARGEKPSLADLQRISEARQEMVDDEANLLRLNPSMQMLPYSKVLFEHMRRHIAVTKALNMTAIELKVLFLINVLLFSKKKKTMQAREPLIGPPGGLLNKILSPEKKAMK